MMTAAELIDKMGDELLGRRILTEQYGDWPECVAEVIKLRPDPEAPEIVFQVRNDGSHGELVEIGVFDHEYVKLIRESPKPKRKKFIPNTRKIDLD